MILRTIVLTVLIGGMSSLSFAAETRGSQDDQNACEPDVHRLCDQYVPNEDKIVECLKKERRHLSPACAKVMARP